MLFNSFEFILMFMPLTILGYFLIEKLTRETMYSLFFLAAASLCFYAYWDLRFLPIILGSIIVNYYFGLFLGKTKQIHWRRKLIFIIAITSNLLVLGFYKYINFGAHIWSITSGNSLKTFDIVLPLGISFFTFTQIAYLADIFLGYPREKSFIKYLLFVTYFPHLIAGPILHHKEMIPQFSNQARRIFSSEKVALGFTIFVIGLFKKVVIADSFSYIANPIFSSVAKSIVVAQDAWGAALAYTLQIYFDFSGYSDMAVGLSIMLGIKLPYNFDAPYKSRSIIEFWRRWHLTLSRFLRDYLYIPFGGNKKGKTRRYFNLLITMVLGGLWHGAGWTYIVWGYLHGCYLVINHLWKSMLQKYSLFTKISGTFPYTIFSLILTQLSVIVAWVFFRAESLKEAHRMLGMMFHIGKFRHEAVPIPALVNNFHLVLIAGVYLSCLVLPNVRFIFDKWEPALKTYNNNEHWNLMSLKWKINLPWGILIGFLFLVCISVILLFGDGSQFLYFQF